MENNFVKLAEINVGEKVEKKNGFSYLSWAWAVDQLMRHDPLANWEYHEPVSFGQTMMVSCTVTAFNKPMRCYLPVIDYKNKPIVNPNAFDINTAMQRCLVKAIALHGLGLYIYAGEDLPEGHEKPEDVKQDKFSPENKSIQSMLITKISLCNSPEEIDSLIDENLADINELPEEMTKLISDQIDNRKDQIKKGIHPMVTTHKFNGVDDAIKWMGRMAPVVKGFKSIQTLNDWENYNRPWLNGLDCLKADKYKKDDKSPKERMLDALMAKRNELENINTANTPIG